MLLVLSAVERNHLALQGVLDHTKEQRSNCCHRGRLTRMGRRPNTLLKQQPALETTTGFGRPLADAGTSHVHSTGCPSAGAGVFGFAHDCIGLLKQCSGRIAS